MNNIATNLQKLVDDRDDIRAALVAKGVTAATTHGFDDFATDIASIANTYTNADEGKVVSNGELVTQTSVNVTSNGIVDTTTNNSVVVAVSNSYTVSDEGKVVQSGALVSQTTYPTTITENGTYDTTTNNSITVEISGGSLQIGTCESIITTKDGTTYSTNCSTCQFYASSDLIYFHIYFTPTQAIYTADDSGFNVNIVIGNYTPPTNSTWSKLYTYGYWSGTGRGQTVNNTSAIIQNDGKMKITLVLRMARTYDWDIVGGFLRD